MPIGGRGAEAVAHFRFGGSPEWPTATPPVPAVIPLSSDGCEYQFGLYLDAENPCSGRYTRCEFGRPQLVDCPPGLAFDLSSHRCNWADQLEHAGCTAEKVIGFHCPTGVPSDPISARFWPYPRFAIEGDCEKLISCVNGHPRIVSCGDDMVVDDSTLTCEEPELVPNCQYVSRRRRQARNAGDKDTA